MSEDNKVSVDQYGRRTWDVEAYAKEAKNKRNISETTISVNNSSLISDNKSLSYLAHRNKLIDDSISAVKTHNIINPLSTNVSYGKDKRFGFFCPLCDLSFRDNLALIDHINSPSHLARAKKLTTAAKEDNYETEELDNGIRRATTEEVISTIEGLVARSLTKKSSDEKSSGSLKERIERRKDFERKKSAKRKEKQLKLKANKRAKVDVSEEAAPVNELMGFVSFGSTKK